MSGKRKLNHDMTPKERAIHFLNIVSSGMASPINGVDKDIRPVDRAALYCLTGLVILLLNLHIGIVLMLGLIP